MTTTERERLSVVETKLDTVLEEIRDMKKTFAAKWVERVVAGLIGVILTAFIAALIALAFKKPEVAIVPVTKTTTVTVNTDGTTTTKTSDSTGATTMNTRPSTTGEKPGTTTVTEETQPQQDTTPNKSGLSKLPIIGNVLGGLGL